ncbi:hypothetical protein [Mycoavidus sp. B2-EB]|uniref:hypothetical protein n=1 Tax=Mycoavidus sp. B2-EB TaxID=2651972 RepID=UPI001628EF9B|nr:hypothetical protein [Mycoavidus sp. B2-EB]BBO60345.1 hypothetical protein MPB2EB_1486 [Mycoavidus sp. B2-EB]
MATRTENNLRCEIPNPSIVNTGEVNQRHIANVSGTPEETGVGALAGLKELLRNRIEHLSNEIKETRKVLRADLLNMETSKEDSYEVSSKLPKLFGGNELRKYVLSKSYLSNLNEEVSAYSNEIRDMRQTIKQNVEERNQLKQQYIRLSAGSMKSG